MVTKTELQRLRWLSPTFDFEEQGREQIHKGVQRKLPRMHKLTLARMLKPTYTEDRAVSQLTNIHYIHYNDYIHTYIRTYIHKQVGYVPFSLPRM